MSISKNKSSEKVLYHVFRILQYINLIPLDWIISLKIIILLNIFHNSSTWYRYYHHERYNYYFWKQVELFTYVCIWSNAY